MKRTYLMLIITMLVIGFAAVATNLAINGTINFGFNNSDFNNGVVFTYKDTHNGTADISTDGKTITFASDKLENVDQKAILRYDVANKSNQYNADVTINCDFNDDSKKYDEWLDIENDMQSSFTLDAGKTKTGNLTVTLTKAYNAGLEDTANIKCTINASPTSRSEKQEYMPVEHNYEEVLLQGADPVLDTPVAMALDVEVPKKLIPVNISDTGEVTKADITEKWYDYENQQWANAVVLADGVDEPNVNSKIDEDEIEAYFVWIPKYRYKIQTLEISSNGQEKPFEIEFGLKDTVDSNSECITPNESGNNGNCSVGKWMTHPAFTAFEGIKGFWVGKFETGEKNATSSGAIKRESYNTSDLSLLEIKPNVYSFTNANLATIYQLAFNYERDLDSHLMKNTEWGAVAYLTQSIYGLCKDNICTEVRNNNNSGYATGYAAKEHPQLKWPDYLNYGEVKLKSSNDYSFNYLETNSVVASTTNNYTGVFDLNGGAWEYVMTVMKNENTENLMYEDSGFSENDFPKNAKYYDVYNYNSDSINNDHRILGDATAETKEWYNDSLVSYIHNEHYNSLFRGGGARDGTMSGIFYSNGAFQGYAINDRTFRIVLAPQ